MVIRRLLPWVFLVIATACGKPTAAGTYSFKPRATDIFQSVPNAKQITLELKPSGEMVVMDGRIKLFSGTWSEAASTLTLSQGNGLIVTEYRMSDGVLTPIESGLNVRGWQFERR